MPSKASRRDLEQGFKVKCRDYDRGLNNQLGFLVSICNKKLKKIGLVLEFRPLCYFGGFALPAKALGWVRFMPPLPVTLPHGAHKRRNGQTQGPESSENMFVFRWGGLRLFIRNPEAQYGLLSYSTTLDYQWYGLRYTPSRIQRHVFKFSRMRLKQNPKSWALLWLLLILLVNHQRQ